MNYHYDDHAYDPDAWLRGWYCTTHRRICDPFTPITTEDIRDMAAGDESLGDDAFVVLSRALRGETP